ncbi:hypothetical protein ACJIZ3_017940 [Penstemon smallii]|uniref:Uncharacterized protein n=1 Tax=Penstemon smallii TaxID=265156 RepID=A0ABD3SY46_9LAMI
MLFAFGDSFVERTLTYLINNTGFLIEIVFSILRFLSIFCG